MTAGSSAYSVSDARPIPDRRWRFFCPKILAGRRLQEGVFESGVGRAHDGIPDHIDRRASGSRVRADTHEAGGDHRTGTGASKDVGAKGLHTLPFH